MDTLNSYENSLYAQQTQTASTTLHEVNVFRKSMRTKTPKNAKYYPLLINELKDVTVRCKLIEEQRQFTNGPGNSIQKITIEIDLSKSKHPWQPHTGEAEDWAEEMTDFINKKYEKYCEDRAGEE